MTDHQLSVLYGITGVGKSYVLRNLYKETENQNQLNIHYEITSQGMSVELIYSHILLRLFSKLNTNQRAQLYLSKFQNMIKANAKFFPLFIIYDLSKQFSSKLYKLFQSFSPQIINQGRGVASKDFFYGFQKLLTQIASDIPQFKGCIIIDRFENASVDFQKQLIPLIKILPDHWTFVIAVNSEIDLGINALTVLREEYSPSKINYQEVILDRKVVKNVLKSKGVKNHKISKQIRTIEGRSLYLLDFLEGGRLSRKTGYNSISNIYKKRLYNLSTNARDAIYKISLLPWLGEISDQFIMEICECELQSATEIIIELEDKGFLIENLQLTYQFTHEVFANKIVERISPANKWELSKKLIEIIEKNTLNLRKENQWKFLITLFLYISEKEQANDLKRDLIKYYFSRGEMVEAFKLSKSIKHTSQSDILMQANIDFSLAYYSKAIATLNLLSNKLTQTEKISSQILLSQCYIRISEYDQGLSILDNLNIKSLDLNKKLEVLKERNLIYRDIGNKNQALETSKDISKSLTNFHNEKTLASMNRTISRTLSKYKCDLNAFSSAEKALKLAQKNKWTREEGKAYLALGEYYRFKKDFKLACQNYQLSSDLAKQTYDYDLLIWSKLGHIDALILSDLSEESGIVLKELGKLMQKRDQSHPLEELHFNYLCAYHKGYFEADFQNEVSEIIYKYKSKNIEWAENNWADAQKGAFLPKEF